MQSVWVCTDTRIARTRSVPICRDALVGSLVPAVPPPLALNLALALRLPRLAFLLDVGRRHQPHLPSEVSTFIFPGFPDSSSSIFSVSFVYPRRWPGLPHQLTSLTLATIPQLQPPSYHHLYPSFPHRLLDLLLPARADCAPSRGPSFERFG
ncbi:hypothetical protein VTI74DRAFT_7104 [Chaetomium olivicolor]